MAVRAQDDPQYRMEIGVHKPTTPLPSLDLLTPVWG